MATIYCNEWIILRFWQLICISFLFWGLEKEKKNMKKYLFSIFLKTSFSKKKKNWCLWLTDIIGKYCLKYSLQSFVLIAALLHSSAMSHYLCFIVLPCRVALPCCLAMLFLQSCLAIWLAFMLCLLMHHKTYLTYIKWYIFFWFHSATWN